MRFEVAGRGLLVLLIGVASMSARGESAVTSPMELRQIMQGMERGMLAITEAIAREEWMAVAAHAPLIANHPQPPMSERLQILGYFAAESGQFKQYDSETHQAALKLQESALRRDGEVVIDDFARLQKSCLACHRHYRQEFVEHFYGGE
ncbi:MAG: cytochrome c [Sedimenticola sp.]|nr:cytochrome c [Sedimenticola sp.]